MPLFSACAQHSLLAVSENAVAVAPNITLAGALTEQAPRLIKRHNAVVIDLRGADEGIDAEAQQMQSLGVPYFNLPMSPDTLNPALVNELDSILAGHSARPVIIHCQSGNRAGLLWAMLLKERGTNSVEANAAVAPIVTKPEVRKAIDEYSAGTKQ